MMKTFYPITQAQYNLLRDWIDALDSGPFKQGTKYLKQERDDQVYHCCLGVLGEIGGIPCTQSWTKAFSFNYTSTAFLSTSDFERLTGLPSSLQDELSQLNDKGVSFKNIASVLRALLSLTIVISVEDEK